MPEFDVTGQWDAHQSNRTVVTFTIRPERGDFTKLDVEARHPGGFAQGQGRVSGNSFEATVDWEAGPVGRYVGTFNSDGRLTGQTFDLANPSSQATWFTQKRFRRR